MAKLTYPRKYTLNVEVFNPEMDFMEFKNVFIYYFSSENNKEYLKGKGLSTLEEIDFILDAESEDGSLLKCESKLEPYGNISVTLKDNRKKNKGKNPFFSASISFSLKNEDKSWIKDYLTVFLSYYNKTFDSEEDKKASKIVGSIK